MTKGRLEAFSDGVIAILITIMVLELKVPRAPDFASLMELAPTLSSYLLSFIFVGIYWHNHHHMLQAVKHVNGKVLWANSHLLFWLSLIPFGTAWMGQTHFAKFPVMVYGVILLMDAISYTMLSSALIGANGKASEVAVRLGRDVKGKFSLCSYVVAIAVANWAHLVSLAIYVMVAMIWFIPDLRFERGLQAGAEE